MRTSEHGDDFAADAGEIYETEAWARVGLEDAAAFESGEIADAPIAEHAGCGCGGRSTQREALAGRERASEPLDEEVAEHLEQHAAEQADENVVVPFEWEDVVEALEAFDENEALSQT